jgi:hypothetical protein
MARCNIHRFVQGVLLLARVFFLLWALSVFGGWLPMDSKGVWDRRNGGGRLTLSDPLLDSTLISRGRAIPWVVPVV